MSVQTVCCRTSRLKSFLFSLTRCSPSRADHWNDRAIPETICSQILAAKIDHLPSDLSTCKWLRRSPLCKRRVYRCSQNWGANGAVCIFRRRSGQLPLFCHLCYAQHTNEDKQSTLDIWVASSCINSLRKLGRPFW